jgi:threonine dehydrogenase-like Zn-dependent dehydrogenase
LVRLVQTEAFDPAAILTKQEGLADAVEAYKAFDRREPGWLKVALAT